MNTNTFTSNFVLRSSVTFCKVFCCISFCRQANQTVARKKRQADGTPILITLVSTFDGSLDLAELSQVTYNIQENLATGSQEVRTKIQQFLTSLLIAEDPILLLLL